MKDIINFLNDLNKNNNREWFESHKQEYKRIQNIFNNFVEKLIEGISVFDQSVKGQSVKSCTYRIYRDVRFTKDKSPYKPYMGAFISPKGKCGGYSGYYFHIEAEGANYIGANILSVGIYKPEPIVLKSIREEIMLNGEEFMNTIALANDFILDQSSSLRKIPAGYPKENPYATYLRNKDYLLIKKIENKEIVGDQLLDFVLGSYKKAAPFNFWLNRAVEYAYETF